MKCFDALKYGETQLLNSGQEKHRAIYNAETLMMHILHCSKTDLVRRKDREINDVEMQIYNKSIKELSAGKPLEYITHTANFFGYDFFVNEAVLIPRIDSEILIENVIDFIKKNKKNVIEKINSNRKIKILDACCGSGCLGLSLVKNIADKNLLFSNKIDDYDKKIELTLMDNSSMAMQIAKINTQKLEIDKYAVMHFLISDILLNGLGNDKYDIILCNPPYIETETIKTLDDGVKKFEPHSALDGGADGLKFYRFMASILKKSLVFDGVAFFEIGFNQGITANTIFTNLGYKTLLTKDYHNNDRCIIVSL